jgi:hypothetical protein
MIRLDGMGYRYFGTHGLLWTDAAGSLVVCAVVILVFCKLRVGTKTGARFASRDERGIRKLT